MIAIACSALGASTAGAQPAGGAPPVTTTPPSAPAPALPAPAPADPYKDDPAKKGDGAPKDGTKDGAKEQKPGYGGPRPPGEVGKLPVRTDLKPGEKRPKQDYDNRDDVTTTAEDALWIPRVLFFPLYIVTEYVIRVPLGALTVAIERNNVIATLQKAFTFGPNNNIGVVPTAFLDFGFRPSIGVYMFYNDLGTPGNDLRVNLGFGGSRFWRAAVADRVPIDLPEGLERSRSYFQVESSFLTRADLLYWGIGPDTTEENISGYSIFTIGGGGRVHIEPWRGTFLESWVTARYSRTGPGECAGTSIVGEDSSVPPSGIARGCDPETIRRKILDGDLAIPPHYGRPFVTMKTGFTFAIDSRKPRPEPGTGVAFQGSAELVGDVDQPKLNSWINYSGYLGGFIDLTGTQRVLGLTVAANFQDTLTDDTRVPFTELVGAKHIEDVPDHDLMRGFKPGRLLGSSAIAATLDYRWPIWAFLDGTLQAAIGNTFAEPHLEDFDPEKLRFSFLGGIRSPNFRDHGFNLLLGFGTNTFEQGGEPSSIRFLFGGTTGF